MIDPLDFFRPAPVPPALSAESLAGALAAVVVLHERRPHRASDFIHFGQTDFPDICDHCHTPFPCATIQALRGGAS